MQDQNPIKAPRATRRSAPRSRTGCITCKLRRLKCGEEKPSCERCVKSGWPCDGYGHLIEPSPKLPRGSSPKPALAPLRSKSRHSRSPTPSRTPSCSPSCGAPLDEREQQYFQTFVDLRSTNIIDRDAFVWRDVALKESRTSSCVRHALAAIGALAMSTQTTPSGIHFMDLPQSDHREFALHQYEKAIQSLRSSIGELETPESCRQTLVSCLVLAFFDNFIGNGGFAVQHMRFARNILLNSVPFRMPPPSPDPHDPEELLWYMFLQLEQQDMASMGIGDNRLYVPLEPVPAKSIMPDHFPNLQEALTYMHALLWEGYHFQYCNAYCNSVPRDTISLDVQEDRICLTEQIHRFHAAVEPLMVAEPPDSTSHPLLRASSLKYPTIVLLIRLTLTLNTPEIEVDSLLPYFEYIFSTARDVLEYEAEIDSTSNHETYTFEVRTIGALSLVATKCRLPSLRRQAIDLLLSSHRREWMHDSLVAGQVASWMMGFEEAGMDEIGYMPEERRAWGECLEMDVQRRTALVKCKVGRKGTGDWREEKMEIIW